MSRESAMRPLDLANKIQRQIDMSESLGLELKVTMTRDAAQGMVELLRKVEELMLDHARLKRSAGEDRT